MKTITVITFPRSGQHLLIWILQKYFSKNPEFNGHNPQKVVKAGDFYACQRGGNNHCDFYPCADLRTTYQAQHLVYSFDGRFDTPIENKSANYLLQYRNPIYSVLSLVGYGNEGTVRTPEEYLEIIIDTVFWWRIWVNRWVIPYVSLNASNRLLVKYEDLVNNPKNTIPKVIKYIEPNEEIDFELLDKVIANLDICPKHGIEEYKYYPEQKKLLQVLEKVAEKELDRLHLPKIWEKNETN